MAAGHGRDGEREWRRRRRRSSRWRRSRRRERAATTRKIAEGGNKSDRFGAHRIGTLGPGFVNIVFSTHWMEERIRNMLIHGVDTWAPKLPVRRALVDFSSSNIAKLDAADGSLQATVQRWRVLLSRKEDAFSCCCRSMHESVCRSAHECLLLLCL